MLCRIRSTTLRIKNEKIWYRFHQSSYESSSILTSNDHLQYKSSKCILIPFFCITSYLMRFSHKMLIFKESMFKCCPTLEMSEHYVLKSLYKLRFFTTTRIFPFNSLSYSALIYNSYIEQ